MQLLTPIQKEERIVFLDVLRGFAILGIYIANMASFTFFWTLSSAEQNALPFSGSNDVVEFLQSMLIEGKFYSIFSMLFGIGFSIYLSKADNNPAVLRLFSRRLFVLFLIGILHLAFWTGDIVAFYALIGFLLLLFRKLSVRNLLIAAAACLLLPIGLYALKVADPTHLDLSRHFYSKGEELGANLGVRSFADLRVEMSNPSLLRTFRLNAVGAFFRYGDLIFQSRLFKVPGMFLIGLAVGRSGLLRQLKERRRFLGRVAGIGFAIGLPASFWLATLEQGDEYYMLTGKGILQSFAYAISVVPLALAYSASLALLFTGSMKKLLAVLAPAGKMALSNYLLQTVVGLLLFTGFGFGLKPMGPLMWTCLAIAIFVGQIIFSYLWLRIFNYGPAEWLWRSATYGKWQKMIK